MKLGGWGCCFYTDEDSAVNIHACGMVQYENWSKWEIINMKLIRQFFYPFNSKIYIKVNIKKQTQFLFGSDK